MKRSDFLLLFFISLFCFGSLILFYKFLISRNIKKLNEYDEKSLVLAYENRYTIDEILELRKSAKSQVFYTEVLFEEALIKGKYLNIIKDGSFSLRKTYKNILCKNASRENTIWIFGGSSTFGYGVEDNMTIPSQLAKELELKGQNWCVKNFARGWYYSSQELLLYTKLISQSENLPKYVFFIDGANDYFHLQSSSFIPARNRYVPTLRIYNSIFHNRFSKRIFGEHILSLSGLVPTVPDQCNLSAESLISQSCENYIRRGTNRMIRNWEVASNLSKSYDITFIPLLQPVPLYDHYLINPFIENLDPRHRLSAKAYSLMDNVKSSARDKMRSLNYIDATTIFNQPSDSCSLQYVDPIHYSGCGAKLIAELMAKEILR